MSGLPQGWAEVPFGELNGFRARSIDPANFPDEEFELYSVPVFPTGKPEIARGKDIGSTKQLVSPGDVLVCKINPRINRVWMVSQPSKLRQIASSEWIVIRADGIYACYLRAFFSSPEFREELCTDLTGVGGSLTRAQPKRVATYAVPLAPLPEQTRIADKLDALLARVDAARERLARVPALLKRFRQSVLAAATSGELTEEWRGGEEAEWREVDVQFVAQVGTGSTPLRANKAFYAEQGTPWVTSAATSERFVASAEKFVTADAIKAHRLKVYPVGTLLVAMYGEGKTRGQVTELAIPATINQACAAVQVDESKADRRYVRFVLEANYYAMRDLAEGGNQPNLNLSKVKEFPIALPSLDEQAEIIRRVEALFALADKVQTQYETARARVDKLSPALLAKAFRGELVPQDPNDEPASALLERLRAAKASEPAAVRRGRKPATAAAKTRKAR